MIDTSMYQTQGNGFQSGLRAGQQMGQGMSDVFGDPLKMAMEKIKSGTPKEVVIAELQQRDPALAQKLIELLNGSSGANTAMMGIV